MLWKKEVEFYKKDEKSTKKQLSENHEELMVKEVDTNPDRKEDKLFCDDIKKKFFVPFSLNM